MSQNTQEFLPLSNATLHILLALASEDRHGYGIMQEVTRQTDGQYRLGPGTLYDNLQKMMDQGFVEATATKYENDDPRRRYYKLSRFGRSVLSAEIARLDDLVRTAKAFLQPAKPRRA